MKRHLLIATSIGALVIGTLSGSVFAGKGLNKVIDTDFSRKAPGSTSGSGDTVEANCLTDPSGNDWQGATATLQVKQSGSGSTVMIKVRDAVPDTVFDIFLRMRGEGPGDENGTGGVFGPNPMSGGGATPLVPGSALDTALLNSPPFQGTDMPTAGFTTDAAGNASFKIDLDFPLVGGAYPFQKASDGAVKALRDAPSTWPLERKPSPIANPADPNISAPWLLRIVSHCTDGLAHGLSPGVREAWFDYP